MKRIKNNKKGVVGIFIVFMVSAFIIVTLSAVFAPLGVRFNTAMYEAGENILRSTNTSIQGISDDTVRGQVEDTIYGALDSGQNTIEVNASIFQYGWVAVIGLLALITFLAARSFVEVSGGAGFV